MPLREPPADAGSLAGVPARPLAGSELHRVWRHDLPDGTARADPWFFASRDPDRDGGGRFDLAAPMGTCYLATSALAAVLEALQDHLAVLPADELRVRRRATVDVPDGAPDAADVADRRALAFGVTAALWAGGDRALTRRWAAALRRDGWWAMRAGIQHDPEGRLRAVALFDRAGPHPPSHAGRWATATHALHGDAGLRDDLAGCGVAVHDPGDLPRADLPPRP